MTSRQTGWLLLLLAFGTLLMNVQGTITDLSEWHAATTPQFVGALLGQIGAVILAAVGGKLLPRSE